MEHATALPEFLVQRYRAWAGNDYLAKADKHRKLAREGQHPSALVISCCDSRVQPTDIFAADPGDFFVHRNIANLVPKPTTEGGPHGTSAAIEYAVTALDVSHILVVGHSSCGGVRGCHDMCQGTAPALERPDSFVGRWIDALRPAFETVKDIDDETARVAALEKAAVVMSLNNLMGFDFVADRVADGRISLHGLWTDIADGRLEQYDPKTGQFSRV